MSICISKFVYGFPTPDLLRSHGFFEWLDEAGLVEGFDFYIGRWVGDEDMKILFRDPKTAMLYKLRWHGIK